MLNKEQLASFHIDYEDGLKRFVNNEKVYQKCLRLFCEDHHFDEARVYFDKKDYKGVLESIHAMKGVTGTLGMTDLYHQCSEIVAAIRAEEFDKVDVLFEPCEKAYQEMYANIKSLNLQKAEE